MKDKQFIGRDGKWYIYIYYSENIVFLTFLLLSLYIMCVFELGRRKYWGDNIYNLNGTSRSHYIFATIFFHYSFYAALSWCYVGPLVLPYYHCSHISNNKASQNMYRFITFSPTVTIHRSAISLPVLYHSCAVPQDELRHSKYCVTFYFPLLFL